jgi:hypothetical protein
LGSGSYIASHHIMPRPWPDGHGPVCVPEFPGALGEGGTSESASRRLPLPSILNGTSEQAQSAEGGRTTQTKPDVTNVTLQVMISFPQTLNPYRQWSCPGLGSRAVAVLVCSCAVRRWTLVCRHKPSISLTLRSSILRRAPTRSHTSNTPRSFMVLGEEGGPA